jgi:WD40 repeat protein
LAQHKPDILSLNGASSVR